MTSQTWREEFFHQISLWIGGATHSSFPECFCSRSLQLWIGEAAHSGGNLSHCGGNPLAWGHFVPPHRSPVYALTVFCVYFQLYRYANVSHVFLMFPKTVSLLWHIFLWNGNYNLDYEVSWPTSACGATRYQGNAPSGRAAVAESFLFWTEFENSRRSNRHLSVRSLMTKNAYLSKHNQLARSSLLQCTIGWSWTSFIPRVLVITICTYWRSQYWKCFFVDHCIISKLYHCSGLATYCYLLTFPVLVVFLLCFLLSQVSPVQSPGQGLK